MPLGGGTIYSFIFHAFFYILQPLLLGYSLYRGAVLYIMPLYWLCPVSAVLNCPHFLHVLRRTLQVRFRTGAGVAEKRLAPRARGAATSTGPCEVTGPSMNS